MEMDQVGVHTPHPTLDRHRPLLWGAWCKASGQGSDYSMEMFTQRRGQFRCKRNPFTFLYISALYSSTLVHYEQQEIHPFA